MRSPHVHARSGPRASAHVFATRRVLVVSNDGPEGEATGDLLARKGCDVRRAWGTGEAVRMAAGFHPSTVVVMGMPGSVRADYSRELPALRAAEPDASIVVALDDMDAPRIGTGNPMLWGADEVVDRLDGTGSGLIKAVLSPKRAKRRRPAV